MFKKILVANRGEIAVRIVRTCREMGINTVVLYTPDDRSSLHVRLADECVALAEAKDYSNAELVLEIAQEKGVDAIHPGYGFLAEDQVCIRACEAAGITFVGPPAEVVETLRDKIATLQRARSAGFATVDHSRQSFAPDDYEALTAAAETLGYPLIIKSCTGGRGPAEQLVQRPSQLPGQVRHAYLAGQTMYRDRHVYLERAILPAYQVGVQIMGDSHGNLVHLGEREGSILLGAQKIIEEAPAVCVDDAQRQALWEAAVALGRLFNYQNLGTVEFVVDAEGNFYFSEIKARIQVEHPLTEVLTRLDLVREQIRLAAGEAVPLAQEDVWLGGAAMMCRVRATDPWRNNLPSPGELQRVRLPGGPEVRVDTYVYSGAEVPAAFEPLLAKLVVWGKDREICLRRLQRALEDFSVIGTATNLPLLQRLVRTPQFEAGDYSTEFRVNLFDVERSGDELLHLRDLAVAAAVAYARRNELAEPQLSPRLRGGWHDSSRRLPQ